MKEFIKRYVPVGTLVVILLTVFSVCVNVVYVKDAAFADWFNDNISYGLRVGMAYITAWIPFSLAEYLLIGAPVIIALVAAIVIKYAERTNFARAMIALITLFGALYVMFTLNFGAGYHTTTLDKRLGFDAQKVTAEDLYDTTCEVVEKLNELQFDLKFKDGEGSVSPLSHEEAVEACIASYDGLHGEYGFIKSFHAPVKRVILSPYMTYTHIAGVYTFFTGEANLNTNYPDFVNVFTTAHEMAHQRGISRENEANFVAYLVCINSDEPYMQYAGYLNMYEYLTDALYEASPELYSKASTKLSPVIKYELKCYSEFFDKYRDNVAADVSDAVNDTYLTVQGTEGTRSYGLVVDLAVAYHKSLAEE